MQIWSYFAVPRDIACEILINVFFSYSLYLSLSGIILFWFFSLFLIPLSLPIFYTSLTKFTYYYTFWNFLLASMLSSFFAAFFVRASASSFPRIPTWALIQLNWIFTLIFLVSASFLLISSLRVEWMLLLLSQSSVICLSLYMVAVLSSICMFSVYSSARNIASCSAWLLVVQLLFNLYFTLVCVCMYVRTCVYVCMYVCMYVYMFVLCMYVSMYVCMCVYVFKYVCMCVSVCMCIFIIINNLYLHSMLHYNVLILHA